MTKRILIALLAISLSAGIMHADNTGVITSVSSGPKEITILPQKHKDPMPKDRPRMPSRQQISCWYDGESLTFDFAIPEGECTLTVTDAFTAMQEQYTFDTETIAEVYIGPVTEVYLELYTSSGHTYEGRLGE